MTLNVRDFGAKGDGVQDDTLFIQAAIMACPEKSRVLIPAGPTGLYQLFLKDDVNIELAKGAVLSAYTDRTQFPYSRA
ncbi:MAG: glycosyl hydrolase family 28-related protein [Lachnospiraceae bacterium]